MSNSDDAARVWEIKRLLDRIQQLPHPPENQAEPNAYYQQWTADGRPAGDPDGKVRSAGNSTISPWLFVLATALNTIVVAILAVLITLGVVRQGGPARDAEQASGSQSLAGDRSIGEPRSTGLTAGAVIAPPLRDPAPASTPPAVRAVELLPIGSPEAPLRLEALKPARLPLQIRPEDAAQESFILVLAGLPAKATLSGGNRIGSDSWLLPPNSIPKLMIALAEWSTSLIELGIELRRTDGSMAARTKAWLAVPPPTALAAKKLDQAALGELVQKGDQLLGRGDVVAARAVYERAAEMGSAPAALALGSTYDPNRLWSLGVFGMVGNKERARQWYQRADQLGHPSAKERLRALGD